MTQTENYQPQVRDTTKGPNIHTYIPRSDGTVMIGGVIYIPQSTVAPAVTPAATVTAQPFIIPPGGPAIPAFNVLSVPQYYPHLQFYTASPYFLPVLQVCLCRDKSSLVWYTC